MRMQNVSLSNTFALNSFVFKVGTSLLVTFVVSLQSVFFPIHNPEVPEPQLSDWILRQSRALCPRGELVVESRRFPERDIIGILPCGTRSNVIVGVRNWSTFDVYRTGTFQNPLLALQNLQSFTLKASFIVETGISRCEQKTCFIQN